MTDLEVKLHSTKLLIFISVITGWVLPEREDHLSILKDQLEKKLIEGYASMNIEEMEYAFRNNPVKDWGKAVNLNLIDEVMDSYLDKRSELSRIEEQQKTKPVEQKIYTEEEILNQRRAEIEQAFQAMKKGYKPIIHKYFFDVLHKDGLLLENSEPEWEGDIQIETVAEFFSRKLNNQCENIYVKQ